jgi:hypothetical protein
MTSYAAVGELRPLFALLADRERRVWEAIRTRDYDALAALSAPDYVSINESEVLEWPAVLEHLRTNPLATYELGAMHFHGLTPEVVAISFTATVTRPVPLEPRSIRAAVLSVWVFRSEQWLSALAHEVLVSG